MRANVYSRALRPSLTMIWLPPLSWASTAKTVNGIGLADEICTSELAPLAVLTPTTRLLWPSPPRNCPTHNVDGPSPPSRLATGRCAAPAGGGVPP
ncbi:MAG: hypothetical protein WBR28_02320, partial [Mycobacterium sp.]